MHDGIESLSLTQAIAYEFKLDLRTENIFLSLLFTFVSANLAVTAGSARTSVNK